MKGLVFPSLYLCFLSLLFSGIRSVSAQGSFEDGFFYHPFSPENQEGLHISDPNTVRVRTKAPLQDSIPLVEFDKSSSFRRIRASLPKFGKEGESYPIAIRGEVGAGTLVTMYVPQPAADPRDGPRPDVAVAEPVR